MSGPVSSSAQRLAPWPVAAWGIGGVLVILAWSTFRLAERGAELDLAQTTWVHWVFEVFWVVFMLYTEAWRGFHKQFSPRVVQRAMELPNQPLLVALAPAVCMGLLHGTRKRLIVGWGLVFGIIAIVLVVRQLPDPWRQLVDLGVVAGLGAGTLSVAWFAWRAARGQLPGVDPEFPRR